MIYVDDWIILASLMSFMKAIKAMLYEEYKMSDLGELFYCLGSAFVKDRASCAIIMS